MIDRTLARAALGAALVLSSTSLAVAAAGTPQTPMPPAVVSGSLPGGGMYVVDRSNDAPVAAIALWYRAPAGGFDAGTPGLARLAAATVAGSAPITGTPLGRFVQDRGGRIAVSAYPNSVSVSALVPAADAAAVVHAMTVSFFAPVVTADGLQLARRDVSEDAFFRQFNPDQSIDDALIGQLLGAGPTHVPTLGTVAEVGKITLDQVKAYADRAFRPANAVLVVTGAVDPAVVGSAVPGQTQASHDPEPVLDARPVSAPAPLATTGPEAGVGMGWVGPPIADEREATALDFITDYLFRADSGVVQRAIAPTKAGVTGKFVTYHDPGVFLVSVSGGDVAAARAVVETALTAAQKPMSRNDFAAARSAFTYHMLSDIQTPGGTADTLGWYAVEGNPGYAPGAGPQYFTVAQSLTPDFVAATVRKYLGGAPAIVTVDTKKAEKPAP